MSDSDSDSNHTRKLSPFEEMHLEAVKARPAIEALLEGRKSARAGGVGFLYSGERTYNTTMLVRLDYEQREFNLYDIWEMPDGESLETVQAFYEQSRPVFQTHTAFWPGNEQLEVDGGFDNEAVCARLNRAWQIEDCEELPMLEFKSLLKRAWFFWNLEVAEVAPHLYVEVSFDDGEAAVIYRRLMES